MSTKEKKSVQISLELNEKATSSGTRRREKREELKTNVAIDLPTSKPHEVIYGKVRLTLAGDQWIAKPKKRGKISKKINSTAEKVGESSASALMEAGVRWIMNKFPDHWTYTMLGFISGVIGAAIDFFTALLGSWKAYIISNPDSPGITGYGETDWREIFVEYILWTIWSVVFVLFGMVVTRKIGPGAIGSGIPELKSILSGVYLSEYLSLRTLFAKIVGTTTATSSGLSIGKEGPLVHAGAAVANQLSRFTIFERIRKNPILLQQMLTASASSGIAANLGCPIGGVLFAIEITSTYYPVRNYWFSFLAAMVAAVTYRGVFNYRFGKPWLTAIAPTNFENLNFTVLELGVSFFLGIVCALLGVLFLRIIFTWKTFWTNATKGKKIVESPYFYAFILALLSATLTYPKFLGKFMGLDPLTHIQDLIVHDNIRNSTLTKAKDWSEYGLYGSLTAAFLFRYIMTALSVWIPVPCGLWLPVMAAGAMLGRIVGELLRLVLQHFPGYGNASVEGLFAVIGAGSLLGAVTHSLSICVIIFEMTGYINSLVFLISNRQIVFLLPVMLSLVTSVGISRKFSTFSLYELIARDRKLPYLPDMIEDNVEKKAREIMATKFVFVTSEFDKSDIDNALQELEYRTIPVLLNKGITPPNLILLETMLLTGTIDRDTLLDYFGPKEEKSEAESPRLIKSQTVIDLPGSTPGKVPISSLPIQISEDTPLSQVHMLFINLRLFHAFVTSNGKLVGVISRDDLKRAVEGHNRRFTILD